MFEGLCSCLRGGDEGNAKAAAAAAGSSESGGGGGGGAGPKIDTLNGTGDGAEIGNVAAANGRGTREVRSKGTFFLQQESR